MISKGKILLFLVIAGFTFTGLLLARDRFFLFDDTPSWPLTYKKMRVDFSEETHVIPPPSLPDISEYTLENILARKPVLYSGAVSRLPIEETTGMEKFTERRRLVEFSRLQHSPYPETVVIQHGVYDLASLAQEIADANVLEERDGEFILKRPVYVDRTATLIIEGKEGSPLTLKISRGSGGFIVNAGQVFILNAHLIGWDDEKNAPSLLEHGHEKDFRPFFASWSGSESYFYGSTFSHLGYHLSKSYGVSFSSSKTLVKDNPLISAPKGWIINNIFEDLYYGFYSYEAEHVVIIGNTYRNNIIYGIDPHDRSSHLIIANNTAYGTKKKHGIIVSREVNDSWIFGNLCYDNEGSGFMLDRSSVRNIVAYNRSFYNGGDGLTLFESQNNTIYGNKFIANGRSGYRLRNSWDVLSGKNLVLFNKGDGIHTYSFDIKTTETDRDYILDPFTQRSGLTAYGDTIIGNRSGTLKVNNIEKAVFSDIEYGYFWPHFIRGDVDNLGRDVAIGLASRPGTVTVSYDPTLSVSSEETPQFTPQEEKKPKAEQPPGDVIGDLDEDGSVEE